MFRCILIILCTIFSLHGVAQQALDSQTVLDSLQKKFYAVKNDSLKARIAFDLSDQWSYIDSVKSKYFLEESKKYTRDYPYLQAVGQFFYANYLFDLNDSLAMVNYKIADAQLSAFKSSEAYYFRARVWRNYAALQQYNSDEEGMLNTLLDNALPLAEKSGITESIGELNSQVGLILLNQIQYNEAIKYLNKSIRLLESTNSKPSNLATAYHLQAKCLSFLNKIPEARQALFKLEELVKPFPNTVYALGMYDVQSIFYRKINELDSAIYAADKGIQIAEILNLPINVSNLKFNKFRILNDAERYPEALILLKEIYNNSSSEIAVSPENKLMQTRFMAEVYDKLGDYKNAYKWLNDFFILWDSSYTDQARARVLEIEAKYEKAIQDKQIADLQNQQELDRQSRKTNNLIYTLIIGLLLFGIIITLLEIRNRRRKEQLLQQGLVQAEQDKKISNYKSLIEGQEKERNRLATELHDGLGGMLAAARMHLSNATNNGKNVNEVFETSTDKIDRSIQELRHIARAMMPPALKNLGLSPALEDFCEGVTTPQFQVIFQSYDIREDSISLDKKLMIYRIIQELVNNAIKHSKGTEVLVDMTQDESQIRLTVEDNGVGMQENKINNSGIGLHNIQSRIAYLNGEMQTESQPGNGTTINIQIDLNDS